MGKYEAFTDAARSVDVHRFVRMQARDAQLVVGDELKHRDCSRAIGAHHAIDGGSCNFEALERMAVRKRGWHQWPQHSPK